jgi:hypothetical protein
MELDPTEDTNNRTDGEQQQPPNSQRGRPPPIILTSTINLIQLQKEIKGLVKGRFEFRNTRNGTRIVTKEMADSSAIKEYFSSQNLNYFTFYPKSLRPKRLLFDIYQATRRQRRFMRDLWNSALT